MKDREERVLGKSDIEVADLLSTLGVDPKQARVIAYLSQVPEGKSAEIERGCRLRQPEVSVATKDLRRTGWVTAEERKRGGKGRPVHYYKLSGPLPQILDEIEARRRGQIETELAKIHRLRTLVEAHAETAVADAGRRHPRLL